MRDLPITIPDHGATKASIVGFDADDNPIWRRIPSPEQDNAWLSRQRQQFAASISCAKAMSKLSVRYFRWADEETNPSRAAHYASEGRRTRRASWSHLRLAKGSYFRG